MLKCNLLASCITLTLGLPLTANAAGNTDLQQIRSEIQKLKENYEARIQALEAQLKQVEAAAEQSPTAADTTPVSASPPPPQTTQTASTNVANPDISLILEGTYKNLSQKPEHGITGFQTTGNVGPERRGFSLAESELDIFANVDPYFYGGLNLALSPENEVEVEEAFIQTLGLSRGFTIKVGRFFSGIGYQNEIHQHAWDFYDAPLGYQIFLGTGPTGNYGDDGVQVRWLAPTDQFLEFGAEIGRGKDFPATDRGLNGIGAATLFAHTGGDIGESQSYRAGVSWLHTSAKSREFGDTDLTGTPVINAFTGDTNLWIADAIWKYAPNGDPSYTNAKVQGEYFYREEDGDVTFDTRAASLGPSMDGFSSAQSGLYLQGVYQFRPRWRVGLRGDWLFSGSEDFASNNVNLLRPDFDPSRYSLMFDYSPTEFSRFRLQFAQDNSREDQTDNEVFLQYIASIGSHGAHQF